MFKYIKKELYKKSTWSGGTTTEIAIYPEDSIYKEHNFLWRLSSATIELEESVFTKLKDYNRFITTLDSAIELEHNEKDKVSLLPLDIHYFDGAVSTKSYGKCVDFNLMLHKDKCDATMELFSDIKTLKLDKNKINDLIILYVVSGNISIDDKESEFDIEAGNTFIIDEIDDEMVINVADDTKFFYINIKYKGL